MGGRGIQAHDNNAQIKMSEHLQWLDIEATRTIWNNYRTLCSQGTGGCVENQAMRKKCACCMHYSLPAFSKYEQWPICGWIDDPIQNCNLTSTDGYNPISLQEARKLWVSKSKGSV